MIAIEELIRILSKYRLSTTDEKETQHQMETKLCENNIRFDREYKLNDTSIIDFFLEGIAVEVKIKGSARSIYRQLDRYSRFAEVKTILLVTNKSMGFPPQLNNKPCYVLNLGKAWL